MDDVAGSQLKKRGFNMRVMTWQAICAKPYRRLRLSRAERRLEVGHARHGAAAQVEIESTV